jgi:hypothetical protein
LWVPGTQGGSRGLPGGAEGIRTDGHRARWEIRAIAKSLGQQFHGGIDEVVPQISRFRDQAGDLRSVDDQRYLRDDAVGTTNAQLGDDCREPGPRFCGSQPITTIGSASADIDA